MEGEVPVGATVWLALIASPSRHLAETRAGGSGDFSLEVNLDAQPSKGQRFLLGASHPEYLRTLEVLEFDGSGEVARVTLFLKRSEESFEEPSLDSLEAWLLPRLSRPARCQGKAEPPCKEFEAALAHYQQQPNETAALDSILQAARDPEFHEARLLAALALMRAGAWKSAEAALASTTPEASGLAERSLLQGILWNFLRRPEEAVPALQRAERHLHRDPFVELELGRAAVLDEDWLNAEQKLREALANRDLAPHAHYLLAKTLLAQGYLEEAYLETKALSESMRGKPLPPPVKSFVGEVLLRLGERVSVMKHTIPELIQAIPALRGLDPTSPPPPGGLPGILKEVGSKVEIFFQGFTQTGAVEILRQTRLDSDTKAMVGRDTKFFYIIVNRSEEGRRQLQEYRGNEQGRAVAQGGTQAGFMVTSGFASGVILFHPEWQAGIAYRYLGRQVVARRLVYVVAFAQRPGVSPPLARFQISMQATASPHVQGLAWITADEYQILRLRTDLLYPFPDIQLKQLSSDVDYRPRRVGDSPQPFWLPIGVTVNLEWGGKRLRNQHIFSDFRLFKVDAKEAPASPHALGD